MDVDVEEVKAPFKLCYSLLEVFAVDHGGYLVLAYDL